MQSVKTYGLVLIERCEYLYCEYHTVSSFSFAFDSRFRQELKIGGVNELLTVYVCVRVLSLLTQNMCVHLGGLKAEDQFRVWVTPYLTKAHFTDFVS